MTTEPLAITVRDAHGKIVGGGEVTPGGDLSVARITVERQRAEIYDKRGNLLGYFWHGPVVGDGDHARGARLRQLTTF